ncbi:TPA: XRE family transcriptional regulator [Streptococcus pneumoniae]|nr:phage repressor protein [Streptococcus pneumoniae]HEU6513482.1 XRE family transcriptional regulator [Streptococcus pneumoniae]HEV5358466.1 XRE family transcriptional regulator [Streptococcus pneumoniae]HEX0881093.1 XRE family transcriptional regulator [Streptococcus pneumoniae]
MGTKIGISKNTIRNYEKRVRSTKKNTIFDLVKVFSSLIDALFSPVQKDSPSDIQSIYDQRAPSRQGKVLTYAERQLYDQKNEVS